MGPKERLLCGSILARRANQLQRSGQRAHRLYPKCTASSKTTMSRSQICLPAMLQLLTTPRREMQTSDRCEEGTAPVRNSSLPAAIAAPPGGPLPERIYANRQ
eukprot:13836289-Alexandrium_andersonii.AAC.1